LGQKLGIRSLDDYASLPVLVLLLSMLQFLGNPILSGFSRHAEHQADQYGLEVSPDPPCDPRIISQAETAPRSRIRGGQKTRTRPVDWDWIGKVTSPHRLKRLRRHLARSGCKTVSDFEVHTGRPDARHAAEAAEDRVRGTEA